jgi:hypothetical protein
MFNTICISTIVRLLNTYIFEQIPMAKPPKKIPTPGTPETHVKKTWIEDQNSPDSYNRPPPVRSIHEQGVDATLGKNPLTSKPDEANGRPSVEVTDMARPGTTSYETARHTIAWPSDKYDELKPIGENTGLFHSPDWRVYAEIGDEGRFMVERNRQDEYQVSLPFAPGVPGPILARVTGQPRWRIDRPGWRSTTQAQGAVRPTVDVGSHSRTIKPVPAYLADLLPKARDEDGIRYDKLGRAFVDTENDDIFHVRKNTDGEYQSTDLSERDSFGPILERIEGTTLWRPKSLSAATTNNTPGRRPLDDESGTRPTKRPRLDEYGDSDPVDSESLPAPHTRPASEPDAYSWLPWGHINKPSAGESVEMGWLHYVTLPRGSLEPAPKRVYFLQNPEFTQTHFEAFEHMLRETPWLQPIATYRTSVDPGEIHPGKRCFDKPLSESVRDAYNDFTDLTCRAVAKKVFERVDNSPSITTTGLIRLKAVLDQWQRKPTKLTYAFFDPMNMLPVVETVNVSGRKVIPIPAETDGPLQRLNFDPQRIPREWNHYLATPSDYNLKRLVGALLIRSDYEVFPLTHEHRGPTLVFKRPDGLRLYFLKLGAIEGDSFALTSESGNELASPLLSSRIGSDALGALEVANAQNNVTWMLGGVQKTASGEYSIFILRER